MAFISVTEFAKKYGISERTARNYCASGKIEGAFLTGKTWNIPADAELPKRKSAKSQVSPLLAALREQKEMKLKGNIYHRTQIDLTYNSNHIEGSKLTHDQTRYIYETNTIGISSADLAKEIPNGQFFADNAELEKTLRAVASPGDIILTVGAGDVYTIGERLLEN